MSTLLGNYVTPVPAQQRVGKRWYLGSADAIFQSLNLLDDERPDIVVVVGADHVYRMDFSQMVDAPRRVRRRLHRGRDPAADRARRPVRRDRHRPRRRPSGSGRSWRSRRTRSGLPDAPHEVLASMGNYVFDADALREAVTRDAELERSKHDMGGDIVPWFVDRTESAVYDYKDNEVPGLQRPRPRLLARRRDDAFLLRRAHGPGRAAARCSTSTTTSGRSTRATGRSRRPSWSRATAASRSRRSTRSSRRAWSSPVARCSQSVLSPACFVETGAEVSDSVLLPGVRVGAGAVVRNAIIDKNVIVPPGARDRCLRGGRPGARLRGRGRADGARQGPGGPATGPGMMTP